MFWVGAGPAFSCSSATFPSRGPKKSRDSRVLGEEAIDKLEADDFDMCPLEKTEVAGEPMVTEAKDWWSLEWRGSSVAESIIDVSQTQRRRDCMVNVLDCGYSRCLNLVFNHGRRQVALLL